ncbi:MAG: PAS domain S-box-containing protein [Brevundimonas sp.]
MTSEPKSNAERQRLAMLDSLCLMNQPQEPIFRELTQLAAELAGAPTALVSLVHEQNQWFAGSVGFDRRETRRLDSFCTHALERPHQVMWVEDARVDERFENNPFVKGDPYIRFYAGAPLLVNGCAVGALCVLGPEPRAFDPELGQMLKRLAAIAAADLHQRHRMTAVRTALHASADALIDCNEQGMIVSWSDGAETLFGHSRAEAVGKSVEIIIPEDMRPAHGAAMGRWRDQGTARLGRRLELTAVRRDGSAVEVELWMSVSRHQDGAHVHANIRDISERKAQRQALLRAKADAEAANLAKSTFLANMSHELRTPLNGVTSMADLLAATGLTPRQQEINDIIVSSSQQLKGLIGDILDLARIESGELKLVQEPTCIAALVRSVIDLCGLRASEKGLELRAEITPDLHERVMVDAMRLRQVLTNLVSNAVKFTDVGSVRLSVTVDGDRYRFEVSDTGIGFRPEQTAELFKPFKQADGTITRRFGGTGLGLAISSDLVKAMGGEIQCRGEPGEGATFWFDLRLAAADAAEPTGAPSSRAALGPLRVLLADDNVTNRRVVELILGAMDADCIAVEDGAQAVAAFEAQTFDIVLMDMMMPVMDGLTAVRALRAVEACEGRGRTPVLMLTANSFPEHIAESLAAGADLHLAKPITAASLIEAIATVQHDAGAADDEVRRA